MKHARSVLAVTALVGVVAFGAARIHADSGNAGKGPGAVANASSASKAPDADLVIRAAQLIDQFSGAGPELSEAAELLDQAALLNPKNPALYVEQSRVLMKRSGLGFETLQHCESLLRKAISLDASFGNAHVLLGYVLMHQFRHDEASAALDRAEQLAATSPWLFMNRGELLIEQGRTEDALVAYRKVALAANVPANVHAQSLEAVARILAGKGNVAEAKTAYEQAMKLKPDDAWMMGNYAKLLRVSMLEVAESERWGRKALAKMNYGMGRQILGATLYLKWAEARLKSKDQAALDAIYAEASGYLANPAEILREIDRYPRAHPIIAALASKGVSLDRFPDTPGGGTTPLTAAVAKKNIAIVDALIDAGADVNAAGYEGVTALMAAAYLRDLPLVTRLLARGANPHLMSADGEDAEVFAVQQGANEVVAVLAAAKRKTPAPIGDANAKAPVIGARYRVVHDIPGNGWTMAHELKAGAEFVYRGTCGIMDREQRVVTDHQCLSIAFDGKPGSTTWAIKNDAPRQWSYYIERVTAPAGK